MSVVYSFENYGNSLIMPLHMTDIHLLVMA